MRFVFNVSNLIIKVSLLVIMRGYLSAWLCISLCLQVSGWNDCLCSKEQMSMGFTYKMLSSLCSLFINIVVSKKLTLFCEYFARI